MRKKSEKKVHVTAKITAKSLEILDQIKEVPAFGGVRTQVIECSIQYIHANLPDFLNFITKAPENENEG